jgi:hypothetical protein
MYTKSGDQRTADVRMIFAEATDNIHPITGKQLIHPVTGKQLKGNYCLVCKYAFIPRRLSAFVTLLTC